MNPKLKNARGLYLEGIRDGRPREAIKKYTGDQYIQHSTGVKDGHAGFIEFFEEFIKRNPKRDIRILRSLVDGNFVFMQVFQDLNDGEAQWVTTDFFDTDDKDRVIEHWDVISAYTKLSGPGTDQIDGQTEITDRHKESENKKLVQKLIREVLSRDGEPGLLSRYFDIKNYIQHGPVPNYRAESFLQLARSRTRLVNYDELVLIVGEGNFVATLCKVSIKDNNNKTDYAWVDLFRIENEKIVEHWLNAEPVPHENINRGKF